MTRHERLPRLGRIRCVHLVPRAVPARERAMNIHIIRTNGSEEHIQGPFAAISNAIGADMLDTVNLRNGSIMFVDDNGHDAQRPVNVKATSLYHAVCYPGVTHQIVGDVAIVVDAECV